MWPNDGIKFNVLTDQNLTLKIDVGHLVSAIGLLLGRLVYPSYGVMLLSARLFKGTSKTPVEHLERQIYL